MAQSSPPNTEDLERQARGRPVSKKLTPLRALKPFIMPYRGMIAAAAAALIVASIATLVLPAAVRGVIDHGFSQQDAANIGRYFLALIAVAVADSLNSINGAALARTDAQEKKAMATMTFFAIPSSG